jgi:hypothetical protein
LPFDPNGVAVRLDEIDDWTAIAEMLEATVEMMPIDCCIDFEEPPSRSANVVCNSVV